MIKNKNIYTSEKPMHVGVLAADKTMYLEPCKIVYTCSEC
jgi:hypothetical protein